MTAKKPMEFTTDTTAPLRKRVPFILDGEELAASIPKAALLVDMARRALDPEIDDMEQMDLLDRFLDECMDEATATRLRERLLDPDDHLDYDTIAMIVEALQEEMTDRPPTKPARSSNSRARTGKGSTGRVRSVG